MRVAPEDIPRIAAALDAEFEWPDVGYVDWLQVVAVVLHELGVKV